MGTYNLAVQACRVGDRNEGGIYIIKIDLASGLEFVDEIQKTKCKSSAWLFQCRGEPSHAKKLDARWVLLSRLATVAVADANDCNVGNVEEGEVHSRRGESAVFANAMAELVRGTEIK